VSRLPPQTDSTTSDREGNAPNADRKPQDTTAVSVARAAVVAGLAGLMSRAAKVLVLFASTHGHTARIAAHIAAGLEAAGIDATVQRAHGSDPSPVGFDAVLLAASVHAGRHQREIVAYAKEHHVTLNLRPSALVSVSLTAADDTDEARRTTRALMDDVLEETGWFPQWSAAVAGALQFRQYDIATRVLMRLIARHHGASTDVHEDHEYTDWAALDVFVSSFAVAVSREPTHRSVVGSRCEGDILDGSVSSSARSPNRSFSVGRPPETPDAMLRESGGKNTWLCALGLNRPAGNHGW
jgi:menaquinone-dependent protoporphyrinogen oxidase